MTYPDTSFNCKPLADMSGRVASRPGSQASPGADKSSPPSGFDPSRGRYMVAVQHSSDRNRDGVWHVIERTDDLGEARASALTFKRSYAPRPVKIFDETLDVEAA